MGSRKNSLVNSVITRADKLPGDPPFKLYQSHKVVEAAPIVGFDNQGTGVGQFGVWVDPGHQWVRVSENFFARGEPAKGDYLVRYDGDYLSWSPKDKFEAGYTEI